jgi:hypothetical protein
VKHAQATVGKHSIHNVQIVFCKVSPKQFVYSLKPSQTPISYISTSQELIEIFFRISVPESRLDKNHPYHTGILAAIFV